MWKQLQHPNFLWQTCKMPSCYCFPALCTVSSVQGQLWKTQTAAAMEEWYPYTQSNTRTPESTLVARSHYGRNTPFYGLCWGSAKASSTSCFHIWDKMCRKNSDQIHVIFSPSLWQQCALLCLPGSLELVCSWTTPRCESPQVISLAKIKMSLYFQAIIFEKL